MLKKSIFVFVLMLIWPAVCVADLTGKWSCDDGGIYYLRQIGNSLYWYGERDKTKPAWSNVLTGRIKGGEIRGNWADVPKGRTMSRGDLHLAIKQGGNILVAIKKTGGFGGSRWKREDAIIVSSTAAPLRGAYTIQQKSNRRYMDAHEGSNDNSVVTRDRQNNVTQRWILTPLGKNTYTIQQKSNRRYMDAHEDSNDNSVVTRDRQNNDTQRWILTPLGKNTYTIQQKSNRRYMDAHEGSNDNSVVTRDRQNNDTQRWIIRRL